MNRRIHPGSRTLGCILKKEWPRNSKQRCRNWIHMPAEIGFDHTGMNCIRSFCGARKTPRQFTGK